LLFRSCFAFSTEFFAESTPPTPPKKISVPLPVFLTGSLSFFPYGRLRQLCGPSALSPLALKVFWLVAPDRCAFLPPVNSFLLFCVFLQISVLVPLTFRKVGSLGVFPHFSPFGCHWWAACRCLARVSCVAVISFACTDVLCWPLFFPRAGSRRWARVLCKVSNPFAIRFRPGPSSVLPSFLALDLMVFFFFPFFARCFSYRDPRYPHFPHLPLALTCLHPVFFFFLYSHWAVVIVQFSLAFADVLPRALHNKFGFHRFPFWDYF